MLVIAVLQFCAESFIARQYTIAQTFVTPLALISTELAHPSGPLPLIQDRAIETVIGALVGVLVVIRHVLRERTAAARGGQPPPLTALRGDRNHRYFASELGICFCM